MAAKNFFSNLFYKLGLSYRPTTPNVVKTVPEVVKTVPKVAKKQAYSESESSSRSRKG